MTTAIQIYNTFTNITKNIQLLVLKHSVHAKHKTGGMPMHHASASRHLAFVICSVIGPYPNGGLHARLCFTNASGAFDLRGSSQTQRGHVALSACVFVVKRMLNMEFENKHGGTELEEGALFRVFYFN